MVKPYNEGLGQDGLGGLVGCVSDWWLGGCGFDHRRVGNILSWRLIMKYILRSFSAFRWFKKDSCQFLAKEYAHYRLIAYRGLSLPVKVCLGKLTTFDMTQLGWQGRKPQHIQTKVLVKLRVAQADFDFHGSHMIWRPWLVCFVPIYM